MPKIPLYFNFVNKYPELLEKAVQSINHPNIEVRVNRPGIKPFTHCLNQILLEVDTSIYFFMHYDAQILDQSIFDTMLNTYHDTPNAASVTSCDLTDLLVLYDVDKIQSIGGWDTIFSNSYMELDLRKRIYNSGYSQPIIYPSSVCPSCINHDEHSKLRRKNNKNENLYQIYNKTFRKDLEYFYKKWPEETMPDTVENIIDQQLNTY